MEKLLLSGVWNGNSQLQVKGGQLMIFKLKNFNLIGTTIKIKSSYAGTQSIILLPLRTTELKFTVFGAEPIFWSFDISTESDAFIVTWELYSSWVPGMPPNR